MLTYLRRLSIALVLVVAMMLPIGGTSADTVKPIRPPKPDAVKAVLSQHASEIALLELDVQAARPYVHQTSGGYLQVDAAYQPRAGGVDVRAQATTINAALHGWEREQQQTPAQFGLLNAEAGFLCAYIPRWVLEAIAWYEIAVGTAVAIAGGFLDATIVGIPVGAILNLIGASAALGGGALLWYADSPYFHPGWYCGWS